MTYFNFFNTIEYKFPDGSTHEVKNIFNRPVFSSSVDQDIVLTDNQSPDNLSISLYDDASLFYLNLLYNNIISNNYWPITGEEYTSEIESKYSGYSFHILETPEKTPTTGDVMILKSDFDGFVPDENDLTAKTLSYGIVESWNPTYRKLWIKNYQFGSTGAQSETDLFKEDSRFYLFKRNSDGNYTDDSQIRASNASDDNNAFALDPNYAGNSGDEFTMKRVYKYINSIDAFQSINTDINPYNKNIITSGTAFISTVQDNFAGVTYNSGNTNGTCSLLEGYILSANGQTGTNGDPYTTPVSSTNGSRFFVRPILRSILNTNNQERNIAIIPQSSVGDAIQTIESNFNV